MSKSHAKFQAVLLDYDGTLVNSRMVELNATRRLFKEHIGREISDAEFKEYIGMNSRKVLEIVSPKQVEFLEEKWLEYENFERWRAKLFPGITEMLEELTSQKILLAVVTAQSHRELEANRKQQLIDNWIKVWVSSDDVENPKPAPDQVDKALSLLGIEPQGAIMIGDTHFDILAGKNAGITTGAAMWGVHDQKKIKGLDPDYLFYNPKDISQLCLS